MARKDKEGADEVTDFLVSNLYSTKEFKKFMNYISQNKYISFKRIDDKDDNTLFKNKINDIEQEHGADVELNFDNNYKSTEIGIDEKAAIYYPAYSSSISSELKTFAFELGSERYINVNNSKYGWLFNKIYSKTRCYLINWIHLNKECSKNYRWWKDSSYYITKVHSYFIKKRNIQLFVLQILIKLSKKKNVDDILDSIFTLLNKKELKNNKRKISLINSFNKSSSIYLLKSEKYPEKPFNIIIGKKFLKNISTAEFISYNNKTPEMYYLNN